MSAHIPAQRREARHPGPVAAARVVGQVMREGGLTQQALRSATAAITPIDRKQPEVLDWKLGLVAGRSLIEIEPPILMP